MLGREREAQPHLPCNHGMVAFLMTTMLFEWLGGEVRITVKSQPKQKKS
jgi:hypothetical protein